MNKIDFKNIENRLKIIESIDMVKEMNMEMRLLKNLNNRKLMKIINIVFSIKKICKILIWTEI